MEGRAIAAALPESKFRDWCADLTAGETHASSCRRTNTQRDAAGRKKSERRASRAGEWSIDSTGRLTGTAAITSDFEGNAVCAWNACQT